MDIFHIFKLNFEKELRPFFQKLFPRISKMKCFNLLKYYKLLKKLFKILFKVLNYKISNLTCYFFNILYFNTKKKGLKTIIENYLKKILIFCTCTVFF